MHGITPALAGDSSSIALASASSGLSKSSWRECRFIADLGRYTRPPARGSRISTSYLQARLPLATLVIPGLLGRIDRYLVQERSDAAFAEASARWPTEMLMTEIDEIDGRLMALVLSMAELHLLEVEQTVAMGMTVEGTTALDQLGTTIRSGAVIAKRWLRARAAAAEKEKAKLN